MLYLQTIFSLHKKTLTKTSSWPLSKVKEMDSIETFSLKVLNFYQEDGLHLKMKVVLFSKCLKEKKVRLLLIKQENMKSIIQLLVPTLA